MSSLRASKSSEYQLCCVAPALAHRVEAEGVLALGRERGEEPGLAQLLGDAGGVLGDLGQRHVGLGDDQAGRRPRRSAGGGAATRRARAPSARGPPCGPTGRPGPPGSRPPRPRSRPCAGRWRRNQGSAGRTGAARPSRSSGSGARRQCREASGTGRRTQRQMRPALRPGASILPRLGVRQSPVSPRAVAAPWQPGDSPIRDQHQAGRSSSRPSRPAWPARLPRACPQ